MADDYEGPLEASRRTIIYTLDFDMQVYFHGPFSAQGIIRQVDTRLLDGNVGLGLGTDSDVPLERITTTPTPVGVGPDSDFGFTTTITEIDSAGG